MAISLNALGFPNYKTAVFIYKDTVFAATHFFNYILGKPFVRVTDYEPISHIFHPDKALPQMTSAWLLRISSLWQIYLLPLRSLGGDLVSSAFALKQVFLLQVRSASPLGSKMSERPMKYPYTYTAKIVQFPWKHYYNNNWMFKYYLLAVAVSFPIFYKLGRLSRSPENVKTWEEIRKKEFSPGTHH